MAKRGRPKKGEEKLKEDREDQAESSAGNNIEKVVRDEIPKGKTRVTAMPIQTQAKATQTQTSVAAPGSKKLWSEEVEKEQGTSQNPNPNGAIKPKFTNWAELFKVIDLRSLDMEA